MTGRRTGERALAVLASLPLLPAAVRTPLRRGAELRRRERRLLDETLAAQTAAGTVLEYGLKRPVYLIDVYTSAVREGGQTPIVIWPLGAEMLLQSLQANERLRAVLDLDEEALQGLVAAAPSAVERITESLASGRLELACGCSQPLVEEASGESIIRRLARGPIALRDSLGERADSYLLREGRAFPQLPQILRGFGFKRVIVAGQTSNQALPVRLRGPDGSEIAAAFAVFGAAGGSDRADPLGWSNERLEDFRGETGSPTAPILCRVSAIDSPAGPTIARAAVAAREDVRFVTPREYIESAAPAAARLESACDLQTGGDGRHQRPIAEAEQALLLAERLDALAYAMGRESDEKALEQAWKDLLDAERANSRQDSQKTAAAHRAAREAAEMAAKYLASHVDSAALEGRGLVLFNPSPWPRDEYMEVTLGGEGYRILQGEREVPSQVVERRDGYVTLGFVAQVPALGYRLLEVRHLAPHEMGTARVTLPGSRAFANAFYSAQIGEDGSLSLDAGGDRRVDAAGFLTLWNNGRIHDSRQDVRGIEAYRQGPVFDRYLIEGRLAGMPFRQWATFYRALPRIDMRTEIDFGTTFKTLQGHEGLPDEERALALNLRSPLRRLFVDSPFFLGDAAGRQTVALSIAGLDDDREKGIAVLGRHTSSYHFDSSTGVLKGILSPRGERLKSSQWWECALTPFTSRLQAMQSAVDYRLPCLGVFLTPHAGNLPSKGSFLMIEPEEAFLSAMFVRQGRVYVRLWNPSPSGVNASVDSGAPLSLRCCSFDLVDEAPVTEAVPLKPWGIQTLRLAGAAES